MGVDFTFVEQGMRPLLAACGLREYADFVDCAAGEVVSRSGTTLTRRLELDDGVRRETVYLKRYRYDGDRWRHRFRRHKGFVEARNYAILRERCGVRVPDVIAYGGRRSGWRLLDAFLITRAVAGAEPLDRLLVGQSSTLSTRRALMRVVAETTARMHARHFYHFDLQWRNLLIRPSDDAFEVFVIDSSRGGLRHSPPGRRHGRVRDLASLDKLGRVHLSRADRIRWLRHYLGAERLDSGARRLMHDVHHYIEIKAQ
ncbi:MAG: lipopolysaccharide kinase InaA family protein [Phycisphaerae bacterium]